MALASLALIASSCGARTDLATLVEDPPDREARCGDGVVEGDEACDDANELDGDDCVACEVATCGDGIVREGFLFQSFAFAHDSILQMRSHGLRHVPPVG